MTHHNHGEANGRSILTEEGVREIKRTMRRAGKRPTQRELARKWGVSQAAISDLLCGRTWAWVTV